MFAGKKVITDETGLIAVINDSKLSNLTEQTVVYDAIKLFPELSNGVVKGAISSAAKAASRSAK